MNNKNALATVFVQIVEFPKRKAIIHNPKLGLTKEAAWDVLCMIEQALYEPVHMVLPQKLHSLSEGQPVYGVEVPADFEETIQPGFEIIIFPAGKMMVFQSEPFDEICSKMNQMEFSKAVKAFNISLYGYEWDFENAPSLQLESQGYRGHIEIHPVREAMIQSNWGRFKNILRKAERQV